MPDNFLNRLNRNPYAPIDSASITRMDEQGAGYDDWNNLIAPAPAPQQQQSWGEMAYGVGTFPARLASDLFHGLSPYSQDKANATPITNPDATGWQVPPLVQDSWDAITAPGRAYYEGMSPEEMQHTALSAAGLAMGGGGLTAGLENNLAARGITKTSDMIPTAVKDYGQSAFRSLRYPNETAVMDSLPPGLLDRTGPQVMPSYGLGSTSGKMAPSSVEYRSDSIKGNVRNNTYDVNDVEALAPSQTGYFNALISKDAAQYRPTLGAIEGGQSIVGKSKPFFDVGFKADDGGSVTAINAYEHYVGWAERNGLQPMNFPTFNREMSDKGFNKQRLAGQVRYIGISPEILAANSSKEAGLLTLSEAAAQRAENLARALTPDENGLIDLWHASPRVFDRFDQNPERIANGTPGITYFAEKEFSGPGGNLNTPHWGENTYNAKVDINGAKILDGRLPFEGQSLDVQDLLKGNPEIVSQWRHAPASMTFDGVPYDRSNPAHYAADLLASVKDRAKLIANLETLPKRSGLERFMYGPDINEQTLDVLRRNAEAKPDMFQPGVPLSDQYSMHNFQKFGLDKLGLDMAINPDEVGLLNLDRIKHLYRNGEQLYANSSKEASLPAIANQQGQGIDDILYWLYGINSLAQQQ